MADVLMRWFRNPHYDLPMRLWTGALAGCLLLAAPAEAADWTAVFPPAAVSSYLPSRDDAVVVVAADSAAGTRAVATALERGFQQGGRARMVMSDAAIRESSFADDKAIVKRCAGLPVTVIAVVRLLKGASAQHAVVTLYSIAGETIAAFSGSAGSPVSASDKPSGVGAGASSDAMAAVSQATGSGTSAVVESGEATTAAEKEFLTAYLYIGESYAAPFRGKYQEQISWSVFYEQVGGKNLRYRYNRNRVLKWSGMLLAPGVFYLGLAQPWRDGALKYDDKAAGNVALTFVGVSLGMCSGGYYLSPHPASLAESRRLADEYNRRLKERLGLAVVPDRETRIVVGFAPTIEGGGVIGVSVGF